MPTDLSKITTVQAADQAIKETEEAIARGETAVIEGSPTDVEMLEVRRIELHALKNHRAALASHEFAQPDRRFCNGRSLAKRGWSRAPGK